MNARPLRAVVLDDVGAPAQPPPAVAGSAGVEDLSGRSALDARIAAWRRERARFVAHQKAEENSSDPPPTAP